MAVVPPRTEPALPVVPVKGYARARADPRLPEGDFPLSEMLMAFLCGIFTSADLGRDSFWGLCFIVVFAINVVIMAFEFPRTTSITILFIAIAVALGAILLNQQVEIFPSLNTTSMIWRRKRTRSSTG